MLEQDPLENAFHRDILKYGDSYYPIERVERQKISKRLPYLSKCPRPTQLFWWFGTACCCWCWWWAMCWSCICCGRCWCMALAGCRPCSGDAWLGPRYWPWLWFHMVWEADTAGPQGPGLSESHYPANLLPTIHSTMSRLRTPTMQHGSQRPWDRSDENPAWSNSTAHPFTSWLILILGHPLPKLESAGIATFRPSHDRTPVAADRPDRGSDAARIRAPLFSLCAGASNQPR